MIKVVNQDSHNIISFCEVSSMLGPDSLLKWSALIEPGSPKPNAESSWLLVGRSYAVHNTGANTFDIMSSTLGIIAGADGIAQ
jgi:hypothetical protein